LQVVRAVMLFISYTKVKNGLNQLFLLTLERVL
jgi:hypothetical protein